MAIYARVSSHDQRKDLEAQLEFLRRAVAGSFSQVYEVRDIASGLKRNRKGLLKLIELAKTRKIRAVAVTYVLIAKKAFKESCGQPEGFDSEGIRQREPLRLTP